MLGAASAETGAVDSKVISPAEQAIARARSVIAQNPKNFDSYNALAIALARRARETSDVNYYAQAYEATKQSLTLSPGNLGAERTRVWLLLGKHEFESALTAATELNKRIPDDVLVYGFLTDANVELGNYGDAERAAQWMLDLRPGNLPGLTRAAYLRELFGDTEGALELMNMAYQSTPTSEAEDRAWILTQMGHLHLLTGNLKDAETSLQQALGLFPGYHYALANLAQVRTLQGRHAEAVELLRARYQAAPHAENLYALADAVEKAGRKEEAAEAFTEFEAKSLRESEKADNSNHELTFYYTDHANKPAEALRIAGAELARRHDVHTLDAYAWALYANGRYEESREQIERALAVGIHDATLWYHAGAIASKLGRIEEARRFFRMSADLNSIGSDNSRKMLTMLEPQVPTGR